LTNCACQIDVMYNRVWMPLTSTKAHLADATKLMDDHKYYEANLALKAVGDSLQTDSVNLVGTPVKGPLETNQKN
jgi:YfdX protein